MKILLFIILMKKLVRIYEMQSEKKGWFLGHAF